MENISASIAIFAPPGKQEVSPDDPTMKTNKQQRNIYQNIYSEYFPRIASYALSFLKDPEEAHNVTNDTFLSLWESRNKLNWEENLAPWLFSVTKNKCLNILKKRAHTNTYLKTSLKEKEEYLNSLALQSEAPVKIYEKEVEKLLCRAVERMPPKVKATFILSRLKGMKYSEIAHSYNISNRTVEARIKSAMLIVRKTFKDYL